VQTTWVKKITPAGPAMQLGFVPAPLIRRTLAFMIDFALVMVAVYATELALGRRHCELRYDQSPLGGLQASYMCYLGSMASNETLAAVYSVVYCVLMWRLLTATVGQRLFNMHVYAQEESRPLPVYRCIIRWAALYGWLLPAILAAIPRLATVLELVIFAWLLTMLRTAVNSHEKQGWHDRLARSIVVVRGSFWVGRKRFVQDGAIVAAAENDPNARYRRPEA
jgi:uncharacterized RDD family membrane protein YckC